MWQLKMRDDDTRTWTDLAEFESIGPAAHHVLKLENRADGSLSFQVYVDPLMGKSDADILARLEYRGTNGFYLLTRRVQ